jgi:phage virion morphogenesis protein
MANNLGFKINDKELQIGLKRFASQLSPEPLLKIAGEVMRGSIERTFREQGSPAGSWPPLAASTLKRAKGGTARKMLIQSGRLKNSINYQVAGNTLTIGTNLKYAAIHQFGGVAGRKSPSHRRRLAHLIDQQFGFHGPMKWRRPVIPARPYVVFRPEDPQRIAAAMDRYIDASAQQSGLK